MGGIMRLKNKKTGEIATLTLSTNGEDMIIMGNDMYAHITKLSELKDYEDYEEPKTEFYITAWGDIREYTTKEERFAFKQKLEIGNYFNTREEAEKSVEKLKAWKRLKDKGFRFTGWTIDDGLRISICSNIDEEDIYDEDKRKMKPDLELLFGGEE